MGQPSSLDAPSPRVRVSAGADWGALRAWAQGSDVAHLCFCAGGIVGSLVLYGVLQERIMTRPYGGPDDAAFFPSTLFLVLANRVCTVALALSCLLASGAPPLPSAPLMEYVKVSVSNVVASTCQYEALKYVSFAVATLGKSTKVIPVLFWGVLVGGKRYGANEYAVACLVAVGTFVFVLSGPVASRRAAANDTLSEDQANLYGAALMLTYLAFDGLSSTTQDSVFKKYPSSVYNLTLYVAAMSATTSCATVLSRGEMHASLGFLSAHPEALGNIALLSLTASVSQFFISYTIKSYGALVFATIMTTRQFVSILLSSVLFSQPLSVGQFAGGALIFATLLLNVRHRHARYLAGLIPSNLPRRDDEDSVDTTFADARSRLLADVARADPDVEAGGSRPSTPKGS